MGFSNLDPEAPKVEKYMHQFFSPFHMFQCCVVEEQFQYGNNRNLYNDSCLCLGALSSLLMQDLGYSWSAWIFCATLGHCILICSHHTKLDDHHTEFTKTTKDQLHGSIRSCKQRGAYDHYALLRCCQCTTSSSPHTAPAATARDISLPDPDSLKLQIILKGSYLMRLISLDIDRSTMKGFCRMSSLLRDSWRSPQSHIANLQRWNRYFTRLLGSGCHLHTPGSDLPCSIPLGLMPLLVPLLDSGPIISWNLANCWVTLLSQCLLRATS